MLVSKDIPSAQHMNALMDLLTDLTLSDFFVQTKNKPHHSIYHNEFSKYALPPSIHYSVKIGKFGVSYFHEFATDSYETSHIY